MIQNKKIKKLEKINRNAAMRFKKANLKPLRSQPRTINKPPRISNVDELYLLESDLWFASKGEEVLFDISMLNYFKYITSVEVRKDLGEKMVTLLLEPKNLHPVTPWHVIVNNMEGSENPSVKDVSDSLKIYGNKYETLLKEFEGLKKETNLEKKRMLALKRKQAEQKRWLVLSNYPALEVRFRMRKDEIKCTELCLNETFLKESGFTLENFTSNVLTEGLPQFFPSGPKNTSIVALRSFMESFGENDIECSEQEGELLMKTGYRKKVTFKTLSLVEMSENDMILSFMIYVTTKSLPFGSYQKEPYSTEFLEILKEQDKEKEYLFNTYYGEKFQGLHSNTEKVCKIKELNTPPL